MKFEDGRGGNMLITEQEGKTIESILKAIEIIKSHKLLNYVIKNPKAAKMYNLSNNDIQKLKEVI